MHSAPPPIGQIDPQALAPHWVWLAALVQTAIRLVPFLGALAADTPVLFARVAAMVTAAEAIARRLLILIATALDAADIPPLPARAAHTLPKRQPAPKPPKPGTQDIGARLAATSVKPDADVFPLREPLPNHGSTLAKPRPSHTPAPAEPRMNTPRFRDEWADLMLRLSRVNRLIANPIDSAIRMRQHLDAHGAPVPLLRVPCLASPALAPAITARATRINQLAWHAAYPSGLPPG